MLHSNNDKLFSGIWFLYRISRICIKLNFSSICLKIIKLQIIKLFCWKQYPETMNHHNSDASCARVNEWCCLSLAVVAISQFESADPSTQISRKRVLNNITTTAKVSKICLHVCYTAFDCCYELMAENQIILFNFFTSVCVQSWWLTKDSGVVLLISDNFVVTLKFCDSLNSLQSHRKFCALNCITYKVSMQYVWYTTRVLLIEMFLYFLVSYI